MTTKEYIREFFILLFVLYFGANYTFRGLVVYTFKVPELYWQIGAFAFALYMAGLYVVQTITSYKKYPNGDSYAYYSKLQDK